MFYSDVDNIINFAAIDKGIYLSDHKPVMMNYLCNINLEVVRNNVYKSDSGSAPVVERFRWDHANGRLIRRSYHSQI